MHRRAFLATFIFGMSSQSAFAANKSFDFKIKTKSGGIVGNVVIEAKDVEGAKVKLMKRYPDCKILGVQMK